jgi:hypothetical protein
VRQSRMPQNDEMQLTRHGYNGASQLISVFYGQSRPKRERGNTVAAEARQSVAAPSG